MRTVPMFFVAALVTAPAALGQCVSLTGAGLAYTQNFDSLSNAAGQTTNTLAIPGWFLTETGGGARDNEQYAVDNGGSNAGDTYSYGEAGSTDRAFGTLLSGTLVATIGACFTNNTGGTIVSIAIAYTGEEWRLGTAGRADRLNFEYSTDAASLNTGAWTNVAALNFVTPDTATAGSKNGNAPADRTAITATIDLAIAPGATVWIRWTDSDASGADDGLAVDDFSLTPAGNGNPGGSTPPTAVGAANPNPVTAGNPVTLTATPTSGANPNSNSYTESCNLTPVGGGASVPLPTSYPVPAATAPNAYSLSCTVTDEIGRSSVFRIALTVEAAPAAPHTIAEINGSGTASPLAGVRVTTRGVVTAVRASTGGARGFYIESQTPDADPNTSEGLLVFTGSAAAPACAAVGNYIQIEGLVSNFVPSTAPVGSLPLTELTTQSSCQVLDVNQSATLPAAITIDAQNPLVVGGAAAQSRKWLGMRVSVPDAVVVGASLGFLDEPSAQAVPSGEFYVTIPGVARPFHGPGILDTRRPSDAAATVPAWNGNPESLRVNVTGLSPAGVPYEVAAGSTVKGLRGIMDYNTGAGQFQLYTDATGAGTPDPATPTLSATPVPVPLANDLTIGSFNMERFYNDVAEGNGAVTLNTAAYRGRLNKASLAIRNVMHMPDIVGLEEVEGQRASVGQPVTVIQDIVNKVNADAAQAGQGDPNYTFCAGQTNDPGGINVAIIYKAAKVQFTECLQYGIATQYNTPGGGSSDLNDRPPLTLRANVTAPGSDSPLPIRLAVNHLRSLSGIDDRTDGERVRTKRNAQAKYLANLINGSSPDQSTNWNNLDNLVVVGDFNSFNVNDGYADVMNCIAGNPAPANQQYFTAAQTAVDAPCTPILNPPLTLLTSLNPASLYSYSFAGTIQTLDHVLLNTKAYSRFRQIVYARNDADFPEGPTYRNNFNRPERVSDHDMPVVYLRLPVEVTSRTRLNASEIGLHPLDPRHRIALRISVTNTGTAALHGPLYVFFTDLAPGSTLPGLPVYNGQPYATIHLPGGLPAGATSPAAIVRLPGTSKGSIAYTIRTYDGSF